ncbi:MAG: RidA family protein [Longimicrobiales bacterium]|nr:RidA family protein [Longimicrobiales bacterium]
MPMSSSRRTPFALSSIVMAALLSTACGPTDAGSQSAAPAAGPPPEVEYLQSTDAGALDLPFSEAVRVGNMLYLAGQVGNLPGEMQVVEGGIQAEARQTMENIRAALERHGSSLARVVKCTVMIDEIEEWGAFNEVYVEFFPGPKPARSAFGADGLALGAAVEVECWATVG